jgi:hypothetical protein
MQARILEIYAAYSEYIRRLVPLRVEDEYLKVVLYFADGSNLRVTDETSLEDVIRVIAPQLAPAGA